MLIYHIQIKIGDKSINYPSKLPTKAQSKVTDIKQWQQESQISKKIDLDERKNMKPFKILDEVVTLYEHGDYTGAIEILLPKLGIIENKFTSENVNLGNIQEFELLEYNSLNYFLGNCFFKIKDFTKAIQFYLKFLGKEPTKQKAQRMNNLGTCYAVEKLHQQALKCYNEAIRAYQECPDEDSSSLYNNIALIYLKCSMFKNAEEFFIRSIEERKLKSPNNKQMLFNSYFHLGKCQKIMRKYDESLSSLSTAIYYTEKYENNRFEALNEICQIYELQEKWSEALGYYEKLSEEHEMIQKSQGHIYEKVSKIHMKMGNNILASRFAKNAYNEYRAVGDERKMSEISSSIAVRMPVFN